MICVSDVYIAVCIIGLKQINISISKYTELCRCTLKLLNIAVLALKFLVSSSPSHFICSVLHFSITTYVIQSGNTGLIAYLKISRNAGFKYLVCCSSPMVEAMCTKFSIILHQFLTFHSIHCASSQQLSFLPF